MDEKVYTPEVIQETPFPGDPLIVASQAQSPTGGTYSPTKTNEKPVPVKRIAVELLSTALNTRSRKILEKFDLQQSGGLQIGNFEEGISGDIRLTPNGLTGRNAEGLTTFALDADGNLILIGQLRSGSVITGDIDIQNASLLMDKGSDIYLDSVNGNQSQIIFQENNLSDTVARLYYDHTLGALMISNDLGDGDIGLTIGSQTRPLQDLLFYSQDGLLLYSYNAALTHYLNFNSTSTEINAYYDATKLFKFDNAGNLILKGTLTQNGSP